MTNDEIIYNVSLIKENIIESLEKYYKYLKPIEEKYESDDNDWRQGWDSDELLEMISDIKADKLKNAYKKYHEFAGYLETVNEQYPDENIETPVYLDGLFTRLHNWTEEYYQAKEQIEKQEKEGCYTNWIDFSNAFYNFYEEILLALKDVVTDDNFLSFEYICAIGQKDIAILYNDEDYLNFFDSISNKIQDKSIKDRWNMLRNSFEFLLKNKRNNCVE